MVVLVVPVAAVDVVVGLVTTGQPLVVKLLVVIIVLIVLRGFVLTFLVVSVVVAVVVPIVVGVLLVLLGLRVVFLVVLNPLLVVGFGLFDHVLAAVVQLGVELLEGLDVGTLLAVFAITHDAVLL